MNCHDQRPVAVADRPGAHAESGGGLPLAVAVVDVDSPSSSISSQLLEQPGHVLAQGAHGPDPPSSAAMSPGLRAVMVFQ